MADNNTDNKIEDTNSLFLTYNKKESILEISHENTQRAGFVNVIRIDSNDYEQMKIACMVAFSVFNLGVDTQGKGIVNISPEIDIMFLQDVKNDSIFQPLN